MKAMFIKGISNPIWIVFLAVLLTCLPCAVESYYAFPPIPSGTNSVQIYQPLAPFGSFGFTGYEAYANPYAYSLYAPLAFPYDAGFNVYSGNYAYNANNLGFYNTGAGSANVRSFGWPLPYGVASNTAGYNQAGFLGMPLAGNAWNVPSLRYDPGAFTFDLGLSAYYTGIMNFWQQVAENQKEEEED